MIRIAITGPESSGKTTMVNHLASLFDGCKVEEYARTYLAQRNLIKNYSLEDLINIAVRQFEMNQGLLCEKEYIICDTEMTVMKIWAEDKFDSCPQKIQKLYNNQIFDFIFLCTPDFKWQYDPMREDEKRLSFLFSLYQKELFSKGNNVFILKGDLSQRIEKVRKIILSR